MEEDPPEHLHLPNRIWRVERRLEDIEKKLDRFEEHFERLARSPFLNGTGRSIVYVLVMVIVALITGTSVNLSGLLK